MTLRDDIANEIQAGRLAQQWPTSDLVNNETLKAKYARTGLRTDPPNRSISLPDQDLGKGHDVNMENPVYYRVGRRGNALVYTLPEHRPANTNSIVLEKADVDIVEKTDHPLDVVAPSKTDGSSKSPPCSDSPYYGYLVALVDEMQSGQSWDKRLTGYKWRGRSFWETQTDLNDLYWRGSVFTRMIINTMTWGAEDKRKIVEWAEEIFRWGGTNQRSQVTASKVKYVLENAMSMAAVHPGAPMNSGYTKVASFGTEFLEQSVNDVAQVINDSRVATSLTSRLDKLLVNKKYLGNPSQLFPSLGAIDVARGGTRPRNLQLAWPNAYGSWQGQFAATQIVACMRDILNGSNYPRMPGGNGSGQDWTKRGVEAVLFMDGY